MMEEYIIRDDYPAEKITNFIKTCKQLIKQKGACNCIDCNDCPGFSEYNCDQGFAKGSVLKKQNESAYQNSLKFLEKYNKSSIKSSKRVFKVISI
jgi:hypothetical protein